jgi:hypothetical protein
MKNERSSNAMPIASRRWVIAVLSSSIVLAVSACGSLVPIEPSGTPGALKEGGFSYCEDVSVGCPDDQPIPDHIAVGATFALSYSGGGTVLSSANETVLATLPIERTGFTGFRVLHAGAATVKARTVDDQLVDYVDLNLDSVASVSVRLCPRAWNAIVLPTDGFEPTDCGADTSGTGSVVVSRGASLAPTFCGFEIDSEGRELGGDVPLEWTRSPASVAALDLHVGSDGRCATVGGLTLGAATLNAAFGNLSGAFQLVIDE